MVRLGRRQADNHADEPQPYQDDLYTGQLHAAGQNRNGYGGTGKSSAPHAGGEAPAGCGNDVCAGTGGDAGRATAAWRNQRSESAVADAVRINTGTDEELDRAGIHATAQNSPVPLRLPGTATGIGEY